MQRGFAFNIIYYMEPHGVGFEGSHQNETETNPIKISTATEIGPKRFNNDVAVDSPDCLGVIDGSGTKQEAGALAVNISALLKEGLSGQDFTSKDECIRQVDELLKKAQEISHEAGEGACVSIGVPFYEEGKRKLLIVNAGDSRATLIRKDGSVNSTLDNTVANKYKVVTRPNEKLDFSATELLSVEEAYSVQAEMDMFSHNEAPTKGAIFKKRVAPSPEIAYRMSSRNHVLGEIGEVTNNPEISRHVIDIEEGDTVVFTTDGATQRISTTTMKDVISRGGGASEMLAHKNVKALPAHDNSTVVVAKF